MDAASLNARPSVGEAANGGAFLKPRRASFKAVGGIEAINPISFAHSAYRA